MRFIQLSLLIIISLTVPCRGGDWPQIMGPSRNGHAAESESLAAVWPAGGPSVKWQRAVGSGFAGVAVFQNVAILFHRLEDQEIVEALQADTGEVIWKHQSPVSYTGSYNPNDGPIAVPLIYNNHVYVHGITGHLQCLDFKTGKQIWSRQTHKDFHVGEGFFGVGSTPIIIDDKLLVNVGSKRQNAGIVAFSLDQGRTIWTSLSDDASYSSPISVFLNGRFYALFITRLHLVGVDPENGDILFQFPFGKRGATVNGANPVQVGRNIFATASYGVGGFWGIVEDTSTSELWRSQKPMSSQYTTPIEYDGALIGVDGRQDIGPSSLICFDPNEQKVLWSQENYGYATLIEADGKLLILKTDGTLVMATASKEEYKELGRAQVLNTTTRALPALSNGLLFIRDTKALKCLDLNKPVQPPASSDNSSSN
ncbi:MAG: PQQ-like beta-propeller repeat protein [Planctomycetaceae bacterium]|nr:PQQ-like beta-propeller repeat protein [Planctomycetaceae bacterium]